MSQTIRFIGGPKDGIIEMVTGGYDGHVVGGEEGGRYVEEPGAYDPVFNVCTYIYSSVGTIPAELQEVTAHGDKLMTLGDLARFVDQARAAGYPDHHVPSVVNSFGGRIRSLTVKSRRRAVE